jgi:N-ethylmaleimide reductase
VAGWSKVTQAVHELGGTIFVQLMHTGRVSHPENLPEGARVLAPSAVALEETLMWVDERGEAVKMPPPEAMTEGEVKAAVEEYVQAAGHAMEAGFDGIELHGANGYLLEQFLHPHSNRRDDAWGGSVERRCQFVLEVARGCVEAIGGERVGIRLSPYGVFNEMPHYTEIDETYTCLASELGKLDLVFLHIVNHEAMGAPPVPDTIQAEIRKAFPNTYILSGGYGLESANADLEAGKGDLVAFGRPYLANPDLLERFRRGEALNEPDFATFYAPGPEGFAQGYTDYPRLER